MHRILASFRSDLTTTPTTRDAPFLFVWLMLMNGHLLAHSLVQSRLLA